MATNEIDRRGRRVGELAQACGLTVRTLHYYEEIQLLVPSKRTGAGHRLYGDADVARLYRICSLKDLGLSLFEIGQALDDEEWNVNSVLSSHMEALEAQLAGASKLRNRLASILNTAEGQSGPITDDLLKVMEEMATMTTPVTQRISMLVYEDIEAGFDYLTEVFGLGPGEITRHPDGTAVHASIEAGDGLIWLHPESPEFNLASPKTLGGASATTAVMVDDVDAHFKRVTEAGAAVAYEPADQPYGYRECGVRDHEGGLWCFMKALV